MDDANHSPAMRWPMVMIRWVDSSCPQHGTWVHLSQWDESKSLDCVSVGYLIEDSTDRMTVAAHISYHDYAEHTQAAGMMVIPKGASKLPAFGPVQSTTTSAE